MMKNIRLSALLLAALSGSLMAQTVATVNGKAIDSSEIDAVVQNLKQGNPQLQDGPQLREEITRRLVVSTAVAQEARRLKLDQSTEFKQISDQALANAKKDGADKKPTFKQEWALFQNDLLNRAFMSDVLQKNPVGDADVNKAYQDMSAYYKGTQEIQLGEIMTRNEADAKKAYDELKAKKSFKTVATKYTINEQAKKTGGIAPGYIPLKDLQQTEPGLFEAIGNLPKGGYSEPMRSQDGALFAIFYVNDKRNVQLPALNQMKEGLAVQLEQDRVAAAVDSLMQKAKVQPAK